jgi:hypothetical protein
MYDEVRRDELVGGIENEIESMINDSVVISNYTAIHNPMAVDDALYLDEKTVEELGITRVEVEGGNGTIQMSLMRHMVSYGNYYRRDTKYSNYTGAPIGPYGGNYSFMAFNDEGKLVAYGNGIPTKAKTNEIKTIVIKKTIDRDESISLNNYFNSLQFDLIINNTKELVFNLSELAVYNIEGEQVSYINIGIIEGVENEDGTISYEIFIHDIYMPDGDLNIDVIDADGCEVLIY